MIELNVYDEDDVIVKTCESKEIDLRFGTVRSIMKLLKVDNVNDTSELLSMVYDAWDELITVLNRVWPDMDDDDWDNVKLNELIPAILQILKTSFTSILKIPNDSKN